MKPCRFSRCSNNTSHDFPAKGSSEILNRFASSNVRDSRFVSVSGVGGLGVGVGVGEGVVVNVGVGLGEGVGAGVGIGAEACAVDFWSRQTDFLFFLTQVKVLPSDFFTKPTFLHESPD
jgi:hypothetical protein